MRSLTASMASPVPTPDDVREQLERIVSSAEFLASDRGRSFLRYIVEETLAGRSQYLKAYTIAQGVFGRDERFDAQNDPCVRMAASHIRRSLERYYLIAGCNDKVLITVPRGQYTPIFLSKSVGVGVVPEVAELDSAAAEKATFDAPLADFAYPTPVLGKQRDSHLMHWVWVGASIIILGAVAAASFVERHHAVAKEAGTPTVLVERFDDNGVANSMLNTLADELIVDLSRSKELVVIAPDGVSNAQPTYVLQGSVRMEDQDMRSIARLVRNADGAVVWSGIYSVDTAGKNMLDVETTIARSISTAVVALRSGFPGERP